MDEKRLRAASHFFRLLLSVLMIGGAAAAHAGPEGWRLLEGGGHVVLIRHALAPGFGDPANFKLGDCGTQRNLSEAGRRQARAIGEAFRERGIPVEQVFSSQWCRCRETAELAFGAFREQPALNSFFKQPALEAAQTRAMKELLAGHPPAAGNLILVTHLVNISALTGIVPDPGEMVVAAINERGALAPKARIRIAP
jgi:phosphohistidine phosphatase SixA